MKSHIPYMYLFVREDLSKQQQIVQSAHAALEAGFRFERPDPDTTHLVLIGAKDEEHLMNIQLHLNESGIEYELFFEPDIDSHTAIATKPLKGEERKALRKFRLMGDEA